MNIYKAIWHFGRRCFLLGGAIINCSLCRSPPSRCLTFLSRLNNLTFTFGIWRGRCTSRGCCYLWGGGTQQWPRACGGSRHDRRAPHLVPHFERTCRRFSCSPHPTLPSCQVTCRDGKQEVCVPNASSSAIICRFIGERRNKASRFKKQSRSLAINIYKYINIYINWIYCKWFPFLLCFSLYIGLHIL